MAALSTTIGQAYITADADATAADVLTGKVAYGASGKITGTMFPGIAPTDISGCILWLDAANRGTVTNQWDDLSGNSNHFTAAPNLPTFAGGVATFNGSSQRVNGPNFSSLTEGEIFFTQKRYADNNETGSNVGWELFGSDPSLHDHFTYASTIYCGWGRTARVTVGNPTQPIDAWHVVNILSRASLYQFYLNEERMYNTTSNTVGFINEACCIGGDKGGLYFQGDMKAIVMYNRVLNSLERAQVRGYMAGL